MRVLLSGATGFIGGYVLRALRKRCFEVMALYRDEAKIDESVRCHWLKTEGEWIEQAREFAPETVIHTAWIGVTAAEREDWSLQIQNVALQQRLLDLHPKQFIALGSQAEYGTINAVVDENFPANPTSAYGAVKLACLDITRSYCTQHRINWFWFRLFSTFGPGEGQGWLIPSAIKKMTTESQMDATAGEQRYSYLYVGELARVVALSVSAGAPCGIYNLSSGRTISIRELFERIRDKVNPDFRLNFGAIPYRERQSMMVGADTSKINRWICRINDRDFDEQLKKTIESYQ